MNEYKIDWSKVSVSQAIPQYSLQGPRENNIVFYNGGNVTPENEVMRIDRNGVRVNPKLSTDEATDAVIRALDGYIKNLTKTEYERGLKEALAKQEQGEPVGEVILYTGD